MLLVGILFAFFLCIGMTPETVHAAEAVPFDGPGTEDDPWLIGDAGDLAALSDFVNSGKAAGYDADAAAGGSGVAGNFYGYHFKQTADIDLTGTAWEPVGYSGDCYFAGVAVTASTANSQDLNVAGGFVGSATVGDVNLANCYVYGTEIQIGESSSAVFRRAGVFAGNIYDDGNDEIIAKNCYYGNVTVAEHTGAATVKTAGEFADGTVRDLLGGGFHPGRGLPCDPQPQVGAGVGAR